MNRLQFLRTMQDILYTIPTGMNKHMYFQCLGQGLSISQAVPERLLSAVHSLAVVERLVPDEQGHRRSCEAARRMQDMIDA